VPIRTRRFNDPPLPDDGYRVLVTRYRPRGVKREDETWDAWWSNLGPSVALHAAAYGKSGAPPIAWEEYRSRYLAEVRSQTWWIRGLADRVAAGDVVTLLCSSACIDEARCHRTLLRDLIEASLAKPEETKPHAVVRRRR
jgi:uncharacterized protein YeaO (DUF488 family)